jgi:hypothetical protein
MEDVLRCDPALAQLRFVEEESLAEVWARSRWEGWFSTMRSRRT